MEALCRIGVDDREQAQAVLRSAFHEEMEILTKKFSPKRRAAEELFSMALGLSLEMSRDKKALNLGPYSYVAVFGVATPVNYGDITARNFTNLTSSQFNMPAPLFFPARMAFGRNRPRTRILGSELAGEVEAVGAAVTHKPANLSYAWAATLPYGAIMASSLLSKDNFQPGQQGLINGASGGIGSIVVQLARHQGAEVTGVCGTPRLDYMRSLGASKVLDYTKEDFTRNGVTRSRQRVICVFAEERAQDLVLVRDPAEAGQIRAIAEHCVPLEQAADAHRHVEAGTKKGPVVITVE